MKGSFLVLQLVVLGWSGFGFVEAAHALCVKSSNANIRSGPSSKHSILWEVFRFMPLRQVKRRGAWVRIKDVDGEYGWIHKKLVTQAYRCAVVKTQSGNIRSGPGTRYRLLGKAERYFTFRVLKIRSSWVRLKDEGGGVQWMHRNLLWIN